VHRFYILQLKYHSHSSYLHRYQHTTRNGWVVQHSTRSKQPCTNIDEFQSIGSYDGNRPSWFRAKYYKAARPVESTATSEQKKSQLVVREKERESRAGGWRSTGCACNFYWLHCCCRCRCASSTRAQVQGSRGHVRDPRVSCGLDAGSPPL